MIRVSFPDLARRLALPPTVPLALALALALVVGGRSGFLRAADVVGPKPADLIAAVAPSLVRVELELQFDKGEAPTGAMDHDPGSRQRANHSLAEVIREERPLEDAGFVIAPDTVVIPDATIHPRFIKSIRVVSRGGSSPATVSAYSRGGWFVVLKLEHPLPDAKPLEFVTGLKPAYVATYFRAEGGMISDLAPFGGRFQLPDGRPGYRVAEHTGVAITTNGTPVGLVFSHKLPLDDSWQGSPLTKPVLDAAGLAQATQELSAHSRDVLPRVRLSFRSPKTPAGQGRERFRNREEESETDDTTERDVLGLALPGNKIVVLANLKPGTTARLQRITVHPQGATEPLTAKFVASLRDLGAFIIETEPSLPHHTAVYSGDLRDLLEQLILNANIDLQGETRKDHFHETRFGLLRTGPRLESYPELGDMSDADSTFLFTTDRQLIALPLTRRERPGQKTERWNRHEIDLTPARLLAQAVAKLPEGSDPANVPVAEADESRVAWLGVELQPLTRELARANGVSDQTRDGESGALVTFVHPDSPAAQAGLTPGAVLLRLHAPSEPAPIEIHLDEDLIRAQSFPWDHLDEVREQYFDRLWSPWTPAENAFTRALTDLGFGTKFVLEYYADSQLRKHEFEVVPSPTHFDSAARFKSASLGLTVRNLTFEVRRYMQRKADEPGVVISKLEPGSKASVAGLKPYEIVTHVNEQPVKTVEEFEKLVSAGGELKFSIKRMAKGRIVTIKG